MDDMDESRTFTIAADHPALPGHFPGQPVVPAVLIVESVLELAGRPVAGIRNAKFVAPLGPGEPAEVRYHERPGGIAFRVTGAAGATIALGELRRGDA